MKVCAFIAVVALVPTPAWSHSWYTDLKSPTNTSCCGGQDCRPVQAPFLRRNADQTFSIWHAGKWYDVTEQNLLSMASPDGHAHACFHQWGPGGRVDLLCVILPGGD